ncbi:vomeronasal type-1 receptor 4-like [Grammomys surdaster]|uniref:vomeronasal type-1 receptor 4-like n=1 Tax=Grammomys surdaster TaxID=491861 RepID=UPI0010A0AA93|nr:vomeronasal type-1 receptor 4-like [Grammomys surdaster]
MASGTLAVGIFFLFQTVLGMLGNSALICCFIITDFTGIRAKPIDLIVKHLSFANIMVILCKGIPQTMTAFGQTYFLDDISCKLLFYLHRVARGVSLGSTSLLSIFQAITISPFNSKWVWLKFRAPKFIGPSLGLCWSLSLLVNSFVIMTVTDMRDKGNLTEFRQFVYCLVVKLSKESYVIYLTLLFSTDFICLGLMMWASASVVFILYKHRQKVQHIHSSPSTKSFSEIKATRRILSLVYSFVILYGTSVTLLIYFSFQDETDTGLVNANVAMSACFPALCPFLLISHCIKSFQSLST